MKLLKMSVTLFAAAAVFTATIFAADINKATLNVTDKVTVDGKPLNPGSYKVEWNGTGPDVQVTVRKGKETVATFAAHVTEETRKNIGDAYGSTTQPDGTRTLNAIYVGGKYTVLQVNPTAAASQQTTTQSAK